MSSLIKIESLIGAKKFVDKRWMDQGEIYVEEQKNHLFPSTE